MKVKPGSTCYASVGRSLGGPRWRQALVLRKLDSERVLLIVRLDREGAQNDAVFKMDGKAFTIVEGESSALKKHCSQAFLALEIEATEVSASGEKFMDDNQDLVFTTASDDAAVAVQPTSVSKESSIDSDQSSADSEIGAEDLLQNIAKIQRHWQGKAFSEEEDKNKKKKKEKHSQRTPRYALLARKDSLHYDKRQRSKGQPKQQLC